MQLGKYEVTLSLIHKCQGERTCYAITSKSNISTHIQLVVFSISLEIERLRVMDLTKGSHCHDQDTNKFSESSSGVSDTAT
jgi:hypothetical protein